MERENKQKRKVYHSRKEFEKRFFPNLFEEKIAEKISNEPSRFGNGLATELLKNIRQQLMK